MTELILPTNPQAAMDKLTRTERKQIEGQKQYWNTQLTRGEFQEAFGKGINNALNAFLAHLLTNFELTPKTEEGKRVLELATQATEAAAAAATIENGEVK